MSDLKRTRASYQYQDYAFTFSTGAQAGRKRGASGAHSDSKRVPFLMMRGTSGALAGRERKLDELAERTLRRLLK
jgi:hypothetical protein